MPPPQGSTDHPQAGGHEGEPFVDDDAAIARALEDAIIPVLACSLVHMTGDPSWIRERPLRAVPTSQDYQAGLTAEEQADVRRRALPAIAAYRDAGCRPQHVDAALRDEMMAFLATRPVEGTLAGMMIEDLALDGADPRAISWGAEVPAATRAAAPVVVIGCGESGILAGIRLAQAGLPFTIVDKNGGPGGTWWENRYPGARVDVGSHQYCYSFAPADWSQYYCQHPELRAYFADIAARYDLLAHCRFGVTVSELTWDEQAAMWHVHTVDGDGGHDVLDARFVISAVGSLNLPYVPDIPGMDGFAGPAFHSARWPEGLDHAGLRVALVGAGASGFQIAPSIAGDVAQLDIYQRTPQWMFPNPVYRADVPAGLHWAVRHLPFYARWFRFVATYPGIATGVDVFRLDPDYPHADGNAVNAVNAARRETLERWIRSHLEDRPDLVEKSIPHYPAMGKRILQDDGSWLRALRRPNVELVRTGIERIEPGGVVTVDGTFRPADVICYATGFRHNDFLAPMQVRGRGGVDLRDQWGDEPTAYLGITVPNFPNLFCVYGPGTNLAHSSSLFFHSEYQVSHALDVIHHALAAGARAVEVEHGAHDRYAAAHQAEISQLVWAHPSIEHSHYKNPAGKVYTLSPWPVDHYWALTKDLDPAAYVLT